MDELCVSVAYVNESTYSSAAKIGFVVENSLQDRFFARLKFPIVAT